MTAQICVRDSSGNPFRFEKIATDSPTPLRWNAQKMKPYKAIGRLRAKNDPKAKV